jgi:uncharacterized protein (TIGR03089 family)
VGRHLICDNAQIMSMLTFYDDATGERTDLAAADLGAWVARTADLLGAECRLKQGDRVAVLLPPHWQTAVVLLGAWSIGMTVGYRSPATAGLPPVGPGSEGPFDVVFASVDRIRSILEDVPEANYRYALGLAPEAAPLSEVPEGYWDFIADVRGRDGGLPPYESLQASDPASVDGTTFGAWQRLAYATAEAMGIQAGDRVLVNAADHDHPVKWLLAPLTVGASVVLCANLDPAAVDRRVETEKVTRVL